ncbi:MAG: hypothetical protein GXP62_03365, partial [Oligoflexia bacterium]|nr:hypothetical protein [Oligoflexia bacterium]
TTLRQRAFAARAASALTPLLGLLAWRLAHGRLAAPERLPSGLGEYLHDLCVVAHLALWDQGRWALLLGALALIWRLKRQPQGLKPAALVSAFALTWLAFFAAVGFFATRDAEQSLTHIRYFLPGLCALTVVLSAAAPPVGTLGLFYLFARSPFGPEASLFGGQAALAERDAAPFIQQSLDQGRTVWVGSYQAAALLQPWAGITQDPPPPRTAAGGRLRIYAEATDPTSIHAGDIVLAAAYGEPTGALERALELSTLDRWTRGDATVTAWLVQGASRPSHTAAPPAPRPR